MKHVSIGDIAKAAGVAPSTVSRALQDHPRISVERRAAIQALAQQMGYRPSQVARSLVTGHTRTLGVILTDLTDPFVAEVMKGAEAAGREAGYTLLFASSNREPQQEIEAMQLLLDRQVEGLIVISGRAGQRYQELRQPPGREPAGWPLVLINNTHSGPGVYSVALDNCGGAIKAVTYLVGLGHRRIAFIAGPERGQSSAERLRGYRSGLAINGFAADEEWVVRGSGLLEDGPRALTELLERVDPPTAVLCYNDLAAIGLLAAAAHQGVGVPEQLAVIGYDNIPLSAYTIPPLTTVDQPKAQMGRLAVEMCLRGLAGEPVENVVLQGELVLRASTR